MNGDPRGLQASLHQTSPIPLAVELQCGVGEVLALVGPSGSGKTTVLRCLAGLHRPSRGFVRCGGEVWLDTAARRALDPAARRVGFVFQHYALFPHLSALENVLEAMPSRRASGARGRAVSLLAKVHLAGLEDRRPPQLSGGQQQRVAVARALAREPHVLLLDEPFSAVDRVTREKLYGELAELRRELAMPVILVTHDLEEAVMLADRMTLLSQGRALQSAAPLALIRHPASVAVARLVGHRNLFEGEVVTHTLNHTVLRWNGTLLRIRRQDQHAQGTRVAWCIPSEGVLLNASRSERDQEAPDADSLDNRVSAVLNKWVTLGDRVRLSLTPLPAATDALSMTVPRHLAERLGLVHGTVLDLRLRGADVHLMAADGPAEIR